MSAVLRCGTCTFGKFVSQDLTKRLCHGVPPTAMQVPSGPSQLSLRMARPIVSITDEACALYKSKNAEDITRDSAAIEALKVMKDHDKMVTEANTPLLPDGPFTQ